MSQIQKERPQEKKPRPQENHGPTLDANIDIGDADDILKQLEEIKGENNIPYNWMLIEFEQLNLLNLPESNTSCCVTSFKNKSVR